MGQANSVFKDAESRFGQDLLEMASLSNVKVELKYNGINNFMKEDLYRGFAQGFLHEVAFEKFHKASGILRTLNPQMKFYVFDALRPRSVQRKMRAFVAGTPYQEFVADPDLGSMHNFGMAIDLTLAVNSVPLDMGTEFDDFSEKSQPQLEDELAKKGLLNTKQIFNRRLLRRVMESAGFQQLPHEWWHYNAADPDWVRRHIKIIEWPSTCEILQLSEAAFQELPLYPGQTAYDLKHDLWA